MALTKDQILSIVDVPKPVEVAVPGSGNAFIKRMNFGDALQFGAFKRDNSEIAIALFLLSLTLCDEDGKPLLSYDDLLSVDAQSDTISFLLQKAVEINTPDTKPNDSVKNS